MRISHCGLMRAAGPSIPQSEIRIPQSPTPLATARGSVSATFRRMTTALRVENVSKQYRIYARPGDRLKETLTRGRLKRHREFWALKNVSFEVEAGTTTGIIGPN